MHIGTHSVDRNGRLAGLRGSTDLLPSEVAAMQSSTPAPTVNPYTPTESPYPVVTLPSSGTTLNCPSMEQLEGIADANDPCQAATGAVVNAAGLVPTSMTGPYLIAGAVFLGLILIGSKK